MITLPKILNHDELTACAEYAGLSASNKAVVDSFCRNVENYKSTFGRHSSVKNTRCADILSAYQGAASNPAMLSLLDDILDFYDVSIDSATGAIAYDGVFDWSPAFENMSFSDIRPVEDFIDLVTAKKAGTLTPDGDIAITSLFKNRSDTARTAFSNIISFYGFTVSAGKIS